MKLPEKKISKQELRLRKVVASYEPIMNKIIGDAAKVEYINKQAQPHQSGRYNAELKRRLLYTYITKKTLMLANEAAAEAQKAGIKWTWEDFKAVADQLGEDQKLIKNERS